MSAARRLRHIAHGNAVGSGPCVRAGLGDAMLFGKNAMLGAASKLGEAVALYTGAVALGGPALPGVAVAAAVQDAVAPTSKTTAGPSASSRRPRESNLVNI